MFRRSLMLVAAAILIGAPSAGAANVLAKIRVEGFTRTIFGPTNPRVSATNALDALTNAGKAGEFFVHVTDTSFGPYVDQVGYFAAFGSSGWTYKVNGVSPPVGADKVQLKDGDTVLWYYADFGPAGGPPTLLLKKATTGKGCYTVVAQDDNGKTVTQANVLLQVGSKRTVKVAAGKACVGPHPGSLVRATAPGAVRSNALA